MGRGEERRLGGIDQRRGKRRRWERKRGREGDRRVREERREEWERKEEYSIIYNTTRQHETRTHSSKLNTSSEYK